MKNEGARETRGEHKDLPAFPGKMFARAVIRAGAIYHSENAATLISVSGQTMSGEVILTSEPCARARSRDRARRYSSRKDLSPPGVERFLGKMGY